MVGSTHRHACKGGLMSEADLIQEIESIIESKQCAIRTAWLANVVMSRHPNIDGTDRDFYILCGWAHVKTAIRQVVSKYKRSAEEEPDRQLVMPGFERLQRRYHCERDNESYLVPIEEM